MKRSIVKVVLIALCYYVSGYSYYSSPPRNTHFSTRSTLCPPVVLVYPLVALVCSLVVLVYPFACLLVVLVCSLVVSVCRPVVLVWPFVCPLGVLVELSVGLFIADRLCHEKDYFK